MHCTFQTEKWRESSALITTRKSNMFPVNTYLNDQNTPPPLGVLHKKRSSMGSPGLGQLVSPRFKVLEDKQLTPVERKILMKQAGESLTSSPASPRPHRRLLFNTDDDQAEARSTSAPPSRQPLRSLDNITTDFGTSPGKDLLGLGPIVTPNRWKKQQQKEGRWESPGQQPGCSSIPSTTAIKPLNLPQSPALTTEDPPPEEPRTPSDFFLSSSEDEDDDEEEQGLSYPASPIGSRLLSPHKGEEEDDEEEEDDAAPAISAPEWTPRPKTPPSSAPDSNSTVRLLEKCRAVRTPQGINTEKLQSWLQEGAACMARYCVTETARALQVECASPRFSEEELQTMNIFDVNTDSVPRNRRHPWCFKSSEDNSPESLEPCDGDEQPESASVCTDSILPDSAHPASPIEGPESREGLHSYPKGRPLRPPLRSLLAPDLRAVDVGPSPAALHDGVPAAISCSRSQSPSIEPPPRPAISSPGHLTSSVFRTSSSSSCALPVPSSFSPTPPTSPSSSPYLLLRGDQPPALVHPGQPGKLQALTKIQLAGHPAEAVVAYIPVHTAASSAVTSPSSLPLVVRASVHYASSTGAFMDVSPPYLYLGGAASGSSSSNKRELKVRLLADRPGDYNGFLLLEYSGFRARVSIRGSIKPKGESAWLTATKKPRGQAVRDAKEQQPPAVGFGRVCVGCSASRELRLRNCMETSCFVRTHVEGGLGFEADGGGEVGPNGLIKLRVSFRPSKACLGPVEGTLRVVVWEGHGLGDVDGVQEAEEQQLRTCDGKLLCSTQTGRRVYTVKLEATAYGGRAPRATASHGAPFASSSSSSFARPCIDDGPFDDGATCDSLTISGDSALAVSMGRSGGATTAAVAKRGEACSMVFFGLASLDFGSKNVGEVCTLKIPLCNPSKTPQLVVIQQPTGLPFLVHHRCLRLRGRAFVRLPIRFVPVSAGSFHMTLRAEVHTLQQQQQPRGVVSPPSRPPKILLLELRGRGVYQE